MIVTIDADEASRAEAHGLLKHQEAIRLGFRPAAGVTSEERAANRKNELGALCEVAFAVYRGVPWEPILNDPTAPDVDGFEVRGSTFWRGDLIVRPRDGKKLHRPFVSVVQLDRLHYRVHGWLIGADACRKEWERYDHGRPMMWLVPGGCLHPFIPAPEGASRRMIRRDELGGFGPGRDAG